MRKLKLAHKVGGDGSLTIDVQSMICAIGNLRQVALPPCFEMVLPKYC